MSERQWSNTFRVGLYKVEIKDLGGSVAVVEI
jgi:hypothetical protein